MSSLSATNTISSCPALPPCLTWGTCRGSQRRTPSVRCVTRCSTLWPTTFPSLTAARAAWCVTWVAPPSTRTTNPWCFLMVTSLAIWTLDLYWTPCDFVRRTLFFLSWFSIKIPLVTTKISWKFYCWNEYNHCSLWKQTQPRGRSLTIINYKTSIPSTHYQPSLLMITRTQSLFTIQFKNNHNQRGGSLTI